MWDHITGLLADPALIRAEITKRLEQARTADPATRQRNSCELALAKAGTGITAMIEAFSEQLITIDELRARMPHLRSREANLRRQIDALDAQAADRDAYLKLADDLEGFLAQLRGNAATATVEDRQRVLRLLVKDILIGPEKITIRHRIPARPGGSGARQRDPGPDTEGDHRPDYLLRWGRGVPDPEQHLPGQARQVRRAGTDPAVHAGKTPGTEPCIQGNGKPAGESATARGPGCCPGPHPSSGARSPKATRRTPATGRLFVLPLCRRYDLLGFHRAEGRGRGRSRRGWRSSSGRPSDWNSTGPRP